MKDILFIISFLAYCTAAHEAEGSDKNISRFSLAEQGAGENLTLFENWHNFENSVKKITNAAVKVALTFFIDNSARLNLSQECMKNSLHLISGVKNLKPWAMRFIDSSAKTVDGLIGGTFSSLGAYDECVDTEVKSKRLRDKGEVMFRGQYCTIELAPPLPPKKTFYKLHDILDELKNFSQRETVIAELAKFAHLFHFLSLRLGICTPSGCSTDDINNIAHLMGNSLSLNASASRCELKEENKFTPLIITVIVCYCFAGFLMFVGSLIDIYAYYRNIIFKNKSLRALVAFSLLTNFRKITNTEAASDTLSCLNGVRFLSISWVILGHTYLNLNFQITLGLEKVRDYAKDFAFQAVINGSVAVDTFFFIGGLLVCYLTIKLVRVQGHKFDVVLYIFHRLWRILPTYVYVIMFTFLVDLLGSGPIWHETTRKYVKACPDYWWTNLLFINNFYEAEHMCIPHLWYIASDFQLYVGALIILLPMIRWPKVGTLLTILAMMASIIYSGVGTYVNDYPPAMLLSHPDASQQLVYWVHFYFRPFVHVSPYCIGLLSGYLLATKPDLKIPPFIQIIGWGLAFIFNFSVLYGVVEWNRGEDPSFWEAIFYASFSRTAWTLGVAWMIICCATGHGGVVNYILSWKAFVPLGRLTYVAYLIHPIVQITIVGRFKTLMQIDHFYIVLVFFANLCVTYGTALAGSILIEAPFMSLEKIFLTRENKAENKSLVDGNISLKRSFKSGKNGDISSPIPKIGEEAAGFDNKCVV